MKVLIVDDDRDQRELRHLLLARSGFDVFQAADKDAAKNLTIVHQPDVVLMDLALPTINDGFELIRTLKQQDESVRIVALTGLVQSAFQNRPEVELLDCILTKPASTAHLIETLRRCP